VRRVDLRKVVNDLLSAGLTQEAIADKLGCTQATVSRYASGEIETCAYDTGKTLVELHLLHVGGQQAASAG
jgi:predicted transcriptional regulator